MANIDSALDIKAYEPAPYALVSRDFWLGHIYIYSHQHAKMGGVEQ